MHISLELCPLGFFLFFFFALVPRIPSLTCISRGASKGRILAIVLYQISIRANPIHQCLPVTYSQLFSLWLMFAKCCLLLYTNVQLYTKSLNVCNRKLMINRFLWVRSLRTCNLAHRTMTQKACPIFKRRILNSLVTNDHVSLFKGTTCEIFQ